MRCSNMIGRTEPPTRRSSCDAARVLVAGGGPAGAAAAIRLRAHGLAVTLVDAAPSRAPVIGERLAAQGAIALQALGVWPLFLSGGHRPSPGLVSAWAGA